MPRILFIGNSFTQRNGLPGLVEAMAAAAEPALEVETGIVQAGGASLRQHWNAGVAAEAIRAGGWDWVVLQEQSTLPIKNPARYLENVRLFAPLIRESGARPALYLTWARKAAPDTQQQLNAAVAAAAEEHGALEVPVGRAWSAHLASGRAPELHDADGSHPSAAGSYLAACVFCAALLGLPPEALAAPESLKLAPDDAERLRNAAAAAAPR